MQSDSLIKIAVDYYKDDGVKAGKALFYYGNVVSADSVTFPSRVEIVMDEDFDLPGGPGNAHRSIPSATPFLAFLNDDHSIDLEFYQSIGEVEIAISQNGNVVYSSAENIDSPIL